MDWEIIERVEFRQGEVVSNSLLQRFPQPHSHLLVSTLYIKTHFNILTFQRFSREWCQYLNISISQLFRGFSGRDVNISISKYLDFSEVFQEECQYFNIPISQLFRGFSGRDVNISISQYLDFSEVFQEGCQYFNIPISQLFRGCPGRFVNISPSQLFRGFRRRDVEPAQSLPSILVSLSGLLTFTLCWPRFRSGNIRYLYIPMLDFPGITLHQCATK